MKHKQMITFLHGADFHLDTPFRDLSQEQAALRRQEQREMLLRLVELVRAKGVQLVLLAGDLLDGAMCYRETGEMLVHALGQMDCPVFIAPGNHDPWTSNAPYRRLQWPKNVHIFTTPSVRSIPLPQLGCVVHGTAFTSVDRDDDPLANFTIPKDGHIHFMVTHGNVAGRRYAPIAKDSIERSGLDYLALGHIHACSGLQKEGKTFWAYPGCPEGRGFDECGPKGVLLGQAERGNVQVEFMPLCMRKYEQLSVTLDGSQNTERTIRDALLGHELDSIRLTLRGETDVPPSLPMLERALQGVCFHLSLRDRTTVARNLWARAGEESLTGLFLRELRAKLEGTDDREEQELLQLAVRFGLAALERGEDCRP